MKMLLQDIEQQRADRPLPAGLAELQPKGATEADDLLSGKLLTEQPL